MILGFSHLIHATADAEKAISYWSERGWTRAWDARGVRSAPEKWPLMACPAEEHDLHLLDGPVRIEVVAHDTGASRGVERLRFCEDPAIVVLTSDAPERERRFFREGLRFGDGADDVLTFSGRLPGWSLSVRPILVTETAEPPLDLEGLSCLAFLSTAPEEDAEALRAHGARDVTGSFRVTVNGRRLRVLLLRSPTGILIELVKVEAIP